MTCLAWATLGAGAALPSMTAPAAFPDLKFAKQGVIKAFATQPDGKLIVAGSFSSISGEARQNIARLNENGSVDGTWSPNVDGEVNALFIMGNDLFFAGSFGAINGSVKGGLAKVSLTDGTVDTLWDPAPEGSPFSYDPHPAVTAMARVGDSIFVGGQFVKIGGLSRTNIAKISIFGTGQADSTWNPNPHFEFGTTYYPPSIAAISSYEGALIVGGAFSTIGGLGKNALAKVSPNGIGAVDATWNAHFTGDSSATIQALVISGTNVVYGGSCCGGAAYVARASLLGDGSAGQDWGGSIGYGTGGFSLAIVGENVFVVRRNDQNVLRFQRLGLTSAFNSPGWEEPVVARPFYGENVSVPPGASVGYVFTLGAKQNRLLVGGDFSAINGNTALSMAALDPVTGNPDTSFPAHVQRPGAVRAIAAQPDGKLVVGGEFLMVDNLYRANLARLNPDGTIDSSWFPDTDGAVTHMTLNESDVYIGGMFEHVGALSQSGLAKISLNGSAGADSSWHPSITYFDQGPFFIGSSGRGLQIANNKLFVVTHHGYFYVVDAITGTVELTDMSLALDAIILQSDGKLVLAGNFTSYGGVPKTGLARISTTSPYALDTQWSPASSGHALAIQGTNLFAATSSQIFKYQLTGTGEPVAGWTSPDLGTGIRTLAVVGEDLYAGGLFWPVASPVLPAGDGEKTMLARLDAGTGMTKAIWNTGQNGTQTNDTPVQTLATVGDNLYVGGEFSHFGEDVRVALALLASPDAPTLLKDAGGGVIVLRNPEDGREISHFKIAAVESGSLFQADGAPIQPGDFITTAQGEAGLRFLNSAPGGSITVVAAVNATAAGAGAAATVLSFDTTTLPVFRFENANYSVNEGSGFVVVTVRKIGVGAADVSYTTVDATATQGLDYIRKTNKLSFGSSDSLKNIAIAIVDDGVLEGDEVFGILLSAAKGAGLVYPQATFVTIVDNDAVGSGGSFMTNQLPNPVAVPLSSAALEVTLNATNGQWRLIGDDAWHQSGSAVRGLTDGYYELEFRRLLGYHEPGTRTVKLENATTNSFSLDVYFSEETAGLGHLRVIIQPGQVGNSADPSQRAGWRLQSEPDAAWHDGGDTIYDLPAGYHRVLFKALTNWVEPGSQDVRVVAGQPNEIGEEYTPLNSSGLVPQVLSLSDATTTPPYLYNGQIRTPLGFGSGVVVKERVVLTAAHVLFDYRVLTFVPYTEVRWLFRKQKGEYEPVPQTPRGWYVREGYSSLRQTASSQDLSSPELQQLDVAAMYFVAKDTDPNLPGGGGYGGYVSSDETFNEWLMSDRLKLLVGYPLDGINETNRGKMHATTPIDAAFTWLYWKVFATPDLRSFGGNSGGPLYVQVDDGHYYPAGIYLGRSSQTLVRAIDSDVVDLISRADDSGQGGGNHTGGGVARWEAGVTASAFVPGLFRVNFAPSDIVRSTGWRLRGGSDPNWIVDTTNVYYPLIPGPFDIEFKPAAGYSAPSVRRVEVVVDQTTVIDALYRLIALNPPHPLGNDSFQITLSGGTGRVYRVQWSPGLSNWVDLITVTNLTGTTNLIDSSGQTRQRFYRAIEQQ